MPKMVMDMGVMEMGVMERVKVRMKVKTMVMVVVVAEVVVVVVVLVLVVVVCMVTEKSSKWTVREVSSITQIRTTTKTVGVSGEELGREGAGLILD